MPLSRYLKIYPEADKPGSYLLYSTRKGSVVRLSEALLAAAADGSLADGHRQTLGRLGMLVESHEAEQLEMSAIVKRANSRSTLFKATIVLNLECNLACTYCYEEDFRGRLSMSTETAERLIAWIDTEHLEQGRDLQLQFYGGEPLLSLPLIHLIATRLQRAAIAKKRKFSITMTTNGTLLTRAVVEQLLPYNFTKAIITLDGPREIHDEQRPYLSGKGSFDAIVANIKAVHDLVTVELNGNYTSKNYRQFPELLDYLLAEGLKPENLGYVQFSTVTPKSGKSADISAGCSSSGEPWLREAAPFLNAGIVTRGFKTPKPTMAACMVEFEHDLVINYDGSFYKCAAFMGWPELAVGSLEDGVTDYSVSHNLTLWQNDTCLACAYLPLCFGGCRLNPLLRNGVINELDCRREFFDATLEQIVRQNLTIK
ncbi:MAG: putative geopeptide radical SAM maturase [Geobacter sp.]|nr:putative geopeptide radical SAM maturase [Geobacter sp.]